MTDTKIIKKYPNRSLYDTSQSKYISLSDLKKYVLQDVDFVVQEAKSKKDITRQVLLQIISEEENAGTPIFTADILRRFIRIYGNSAEAPFADYIEQMSTLLDQQTRRFWEQFADTPEFNPAAAWNEIARRNLAIWQETQENLMRAVNKKTEGE